MAAYVYKYVHPEKGCIYVGRTKNLTDRILSHNQSKYDNIPREFEAILNESDVYYCEVANVAESIILETYLINTIKPKLNHAMKYDGVTLGLQLMAPDFHLLDSATLSEMRQCKQKCNNAKPNAHRKRPLRGGMYDDDVHMDDYTSLHKYMLSKLDQRTLMLYNFLIDTAAKQRGEHPGDYVCSMSDLGKLYGIQLNNKKQVQELGYMLRTDFQILFIRCFANIGAHRDAYALVEDVCMYRVTSKDGKVKYNFNDAIERNVLEGMNAESAQS